MNQATQSKHLYFLMDPLEGLSPEKDTTLLLMETASKLGHLTYYVSKNGLSWQNHELHVEAQEVVINRSKTPFFESKDIKRCRFSEVDTFFIRTDPPFNEEYLYHTWMLEHAPAHVSIINSPQGIRSMNEKLGALQFKNLIPPTLVSQNKDLILSTLAKEGKLVLKPTNSFGGEGIFILKHDDPNKHVIIETSTKHGLMPVICQSFLPEAAEGDKRIILCDGEPIGAVLRVHTKDDHRNNIFAGGKTIQADITPRDLDIIAEIKPTLLDLGLRFVGIDIIGDYLIEINVTSPTCLQEMEVLNQKPLSVDIIKQFTKT